MHKSIVSALFGFTLAFGAAAVQAQSFDTVNWTPDGVADGKGTGTLSNGTITVNYITAAGARGNSGETFQRNWDTILGTASGVGSGVNHLSGGALGEPHGAQTQTIQFSASVTNPIILVDYTDSDSSFNFGAIPITLLSSHNAQLAGGLLTFLGSTDKLDDGFAAQLTGTFGPGTPLVFQSTATGFESQAFTLGLSLGRSQTAVPEPGSIALMFSMTITGAAFLARRRKQAGKSA